MAGLAFAERSTEMEHSFSLDAGSVSGFAESEVSAVYPYLRSSFGSDSQAWGLFGFGSGSVDSLWSGFDGVPLPEGGDSIHIYGDLDFSLGLVGAEHRLFERSGFTLSAVGDTGWSALAVSGGSADGVAASVSRSRLGLEGTFTTAAAAGEARWVSTLRAGARRDGGDGQTAQGVELAGVVARMWGRYEAGLRGRWYAADTTDAVFGDQGIEARLRLKAREGGAGFAFQVTPGWGTKGEASKDETGLLGSLDVREPIPECYLQGRVSFGHRVRGQGWMGPGELLTPYAELSLEQSGARVLRSGVGLEVDVNVRLAGERRDSAAGDADHAVTLRLDVRF